MGITISKRMKQRIYYEINEEQAIVVQEVYRLYAEDFGHWSLVTRELNRPENSNQESAISKWERSTVWAMPRNPSHSGNVCYGKTEHAERQRITKSIRAKGGYRK